MDKLSNCLLMVIIPYASPVTLNVHSYLQSTKALCGQDGGSRASVAYTGIFFRGGGFNKFS